MTRYDASFPSLVCSCTRQGIPNICALPGLSSSIQCLISPGLYFVRAPCRTTVRPWYLSRRKGSVNTRAILGASDCTKDIGRWASIANWTSDGLEGRIRTLGYFHSIVSLYWRSLYIRATTFLLSYTPHATSCIYYQYIRSSYPRVIVIVIVHGAPWSHYHSPRHSLAVTVPLGVARFELPLSVSLFPSRLARLPSCLASLPLRVSRVFGFSVGPCWWG